MKHGYYWVRLKDRYQDKWEPLYVDDLVHVGYDEMPLENYEIGDYIPMPDKYKE